MPRKSNPARAPWVPIPTKLHPPRPPAGAVERPRLLSMLDEGSRRRCILLSAPAGYGKTSLAVQWLERSPAASAWLSLSAADDEIGGFIRYLVTAIERAVPGSLPKSAALLASHVTPPWSQVSQVLLAELAQVNEPLIVVIDDYQLLAAPEVHELMRRLVEELPEIIHLMVLSRSDPALPLARWRGRGWLAELRARDLRFTRKECVSYFEAANELRVDTRELEPLFDLLEGWPVGLKLAHLSMARAADPAAVARGFSGSDRLIVEYLMEEVLAAQAPEMRRFLAATAPLDRFCAELCERMLPQGESGPSAAELLTEARRQGLFLVSLDSEARWFRYHHLFAQLLDRHLVPAAAKENRAEFARRAAEWFAEAGHAEEALRLWIDVGEIDAAASLLGQHLDDILDQDGALWILRRWLALFPAGAEDGRLELLIARAHEKFIQWDIAGIQATADLAEACLEETTETRAVDFRTDIEAFRCFLAYWQGDAEATIRHGDRAFADAGIARRRWVRSLVAIYRAGGLFLAGRFAEAHGFLADQALDEDVRSGPHFGRYLLIPGFLHLQSNEFEAARNTALRVLSSSETVPISGYWLGEAEYLLGTVALERDHLEEAETWFRRVLQRKYHLLSRFHHEALIGLALVAERRGDLAGRDEWAAEARAWALEASDPGSLLISDSFESRGRPNLPEADRSDSTLSRLVDVASLWLEVPSVTACERLLLAPDPEVRSTALPAIEAATARFKARHNVRQALRLEVLRADALADAGRRDEALKLLGGLLRRAEREGLVRPFLGGGPLRRELLATLGSHGPQRRFVERILSSPSTSGAERPAASPQLDPEPLIDPLTPREQEVLDLLSERLANKEIAAQLGVSSEAIKKRLLGVYSKLGVHGRREAVAAALARGLIERRSR